MYKHILLPTDGSELSRQAVASGIEFARYLHATVTGVHVVPVPHTDQLEAWMHNDPNYEAHRLAVFDNLADEYLSFISNSASAAGVPCTCIKVREREAYRAILSVAEQTPCDLIYMASHGWKGDQAQLLGSETMKVLIHSKIPVLVHKPARE